MKVTNLEVVCVLKPDSIFSQKTQKSYPCVSVEFPDGTIRRVIDNRLLSALLTTIYCNQEGGDTN